MLKQSSYKILITGAILLLFTTVELFFLRPLPEAMQEDYRKLSEGEYQLVFLSMYPIDNYTEEGFASRYGHAPLLTSYEIPNLSTLKDYLKEVNAAGTVSTVYLGVRPEALDGSRLAELLLSYPHISFQVILPHPSMDYWLSLSEKKCDRLLQAYRDFLPPLVNHENIFLYNFTNAQWLIANPDNYENEFLTTPEISDFIMFHTNRDLPYCISHADPGSVTAYIDALAGLIAHHRTNATVYPDLSDWNIVFFGDSVIGNYTGSVSIPGVTAALTGARVYNMGYGGTCMTKTPEEKPAMTDVATAFVQQKPDLLPVESQAYLGMKEYCDNPPAGQLCIVINYGLNDYFSGRSMESDDPYDIYTFKGATRTCVKMLQDAYPDAHILLNTPNFTDYFDNGTEPHEGYVMVDYVNALKELAKELNIALLDNYNELGITAGNIRTYSDDGCHPNEVGRFLIGQRIAMKLGNL